MKTKMWLVTVAVLFIPKPSPAPTGVGGGGDLLEMFLAGTRQILVRVLPKIPYATDDELCECNDEENSDISCQFLKSMSPERKDFCRRFLRMTAKQMLRLNTQGPMTQFEISTKPLIVNKKKVFAKTNLGPYGEIKFHHDSIRKLWPMPMLSLMGHEFGHKVSWKGTFIKDENPIGPFNFKEGGRALLDTIGAAIATYAAKQHWVSQYIGIDDLYSCEITDIDATTRSSAAGYSPRLYSDTALEKYESSVGIMPRDFKCFQRLENAEIHVRLKVHEEKACEEGAKKSERWTTAELWRVTDSKSSKVGSKTLVEFNPICEDAETKPIELEFKNYRFKIWYERE